jgi:hypothetical protein
MAVPSDKLVPVISGYPLCLTVEKKDTPLLIVGNDALHEAVENAFEVLLVGEELVQGQIHVLFSRNTGEGIGVSLMIS